jgi:hypothetical protein
MIENYYDYTIIKTNFVVFKYKYLQIVKNTFKKYSKYLKKYFKKIVFRIPKNTSKSILIHVFKYFYSNTLQDCVELCTGLILQVYNIHLYVHVSTNIPYKL